MCICTAPPPPPPPTRGRRSRFCSADSGLFIFNLFLHFVSALLEFRNGRTNKLKAVNEVYGGEASSGCLPGLHPQLSRPVGRTLIHGSSILFFIFFFSGTLDVPSGDGGNGATVFRTPTWTLTPLSLLSRRLQLFNDSVATVRE